MFVSAHDEIDLYSLELVCLYVKKCKKINNLLVNLNARYKVEIKEGNLHVDDNPDFIDLFYTKYKVNLKVLCGQNGVGKTTIINILRNREFGADFYVLFIDKNGNFSATQQVNLYFNGARKQLFYGYVIDHLSEICATHAEYESDNLSISKKIIDSYSEHPKIYDEIVNRKLFTHFTISLWNLELESDDISNHLGRKLNVNFERYALVQFFKKNPVDYIFFSLSRDNTFDSFWERISDSKNNSVQLADLKKTTIDIISKNKYDEFHKSLSELLCNDTTQQKEQSFFPLDELKKKISILDIIYINISEIICKKLKTRNENIFITKQYFNDIFYYKPLYYDGKSIIYLEDLSQGEQHYIGNIYSLLPAMLQSDGVWHFADEPDRSLHPEWKRLFIKKYLDSINIIRKYIYSAKVKNNNYRPHEKNKVYNIIMTTHSPFLLSDLTKDFIVFLDYNKKEIIVRDDVKNTFAGNIGEMFYTNFFMQETIGEFAKELLEKNLKEIDNGVSEERKQELKRLFSAVGDDILRELLLDRLETHEINDEKNNHYSFN